MNTEETINELMVKWEYLVPATLQKLYGNVEQFAKSRQLEKDDLMQFGMIGLWVGIKSWLENPIGQERSFLIRNIRWYLGKMLLREQDRHKYYKNHTKKYTDKNYIVNVMSMSKSFDEDSQTDFYDIISCDNIVNFKEDNLIETKVFANEEYNTMLNMLTDDELRIIHMKMSGMNYQQIGTHFNMTKQGIGNRFKKIKNKISKYRRVAI